MKKRIRKLMAVVLSIIMIFSVLLTIPFSAYAEKYSGKCGDNLIWRLDSNTGVLTISGSGRMYDYFKDDYWDRSPWIIEKPHSVKKVIIEAGVTYIGENAFASYAFSHNISENSVSIANSVTEIGEQAFYDANISSIVIPNSVTKIGQDAFSWSELSSVVLPNNLRTIPNGSFNMCRNLTRVTIPRSVTEIESGAFYDCALTSVEIPSGVKAIGAYAFSCYSLTSATIFDRGTTIGENGLWGKNLTIYGQNNSYAQTYANNNNIPFVLINPLNAKPDVHYNYSEEVETSQDDINLDFSDANCDIDLGSISGPSINILGHKFDLLNFDADLSFSIKGVSATYKVDKDKKTVRVILGYGEKAEAEIKDGGKYNEEYQDLKELYRFIGKKVVNGPDEWNKYQKLRSKTLKKLIDKDGKMVLNAAIKVTGYMEFSYETGTLVSVESGVMLVGEIGVKYTWRPSIFYITTGLKGTVDATVTFAYEQSGKPYLSKFSTAFELAANLGIGIGTKAFKLYAEGGLKGSLKLSAANDFIANKVDLKVNLTGALYVEAKAWLATYKKTWDFYNEDVFAKTINYKSVKRGAIFESSDTPTSIKRNYQYTKIQSAQKSSKGLLRGASQDNTVFSQNNIFPYSMPVYLNLNDGRSIVIWVGDDGTKTDNNRTSIMYSICENKTWSQPAVLQDNGTYNDMPCAYSDGEKVYLVWQRAKNVFADETEVEQAVSQLDLYYSVFDGNAFSSPVCITDDNNDIYEDTMSIYGTDGTQVVSWRQNDENAVFEETGNDCLHYRLCQNGIWQAATEVITTGAHIDEQICTIESGVPAIYYIVNGETNTLYRYDTNTNTTTQIAGGDNVNSLSVVNGKVYYLCDDYLFAYNGESTKVTDVQLNNYQLVTNGEKETLFTLYSAGLKNTLYSCEKNSDSESFDELTLFADYDSNIRNYYAVMDSNGLTSVAVNSVAVNEENIQTGNDVYGSADLFITEKENYYDIGIDYFSYDSSDISPSNNIEFTYQINNSGNVTQNGFTAQLYSENGDLIKSEYVECELEPGQSETFSISYLLPESISKEEITLKILADNDNFITNNTTSTTIGLADVTFSDLSVYASNNTAILRGYVKNDGYDSAEDVSVSVSRLVDGEKAEIENIDVGNLEANEIKEVVVELPSDMLMTDNPDVMNGLYLSATTSSSETTLSNNDDKFVYDTLITGDYDNATYYLYNNGELWLNGNETVHYYETNNNPMILYGDRISSIKLNTSVEHEDLKFFAAPIEWNDKAAVNFMVKKDMINDFGYESPCAVFSLGGKDITVSDYETDENYYIFKMDNITADQLNEEITATLYATYKDAMFSGASTNSTALDLGKQGCDLSGDDFVDVKDFVRIKKKVCGIPVSEESNNAADPDFNGTLDTRDVRYLVNILLFI